MDGYPEPYRRVRTDHDEQIGNAISGNRLTLSTALGYMGVWDPIWPGDILYRIGCAPASSPDFDKVPSPERVEDTGYECFEDYIADLRSYTSYGQCNAQKGFLSPHAKNDSVPAALNWSGQIKHQVIPSETHQRSSSEGERRFAHISPADYVSDGSCQRAWCGNNPMCLVGRPFAIFDGRLRRRNNTEENTTTAMFDKIIHFSKHIPSTATYPVYAGYPAVLCGGPIRVSPYQLPPSVSGKDEGGRSRILTGTTTDFQNDFLRILDAEDGHGIVALDDNEKSSPRRVQSLRRSLEVAYGQRDSDTNTYRTRCYFVNIRLLREAENVRAKSAFCLFRHLPAPPCPPTAIRAFVDKLIKRGLTLMDGFVFLPVINDHIELAVSCTSPK